MGFEINQYLLFLSVKETETQKDKWFLIIVQVIDGGEPDRDDSKIHFLLPAVLS